MSAIKGSAQWNVNQLEMQHGVSGVIRMLARRCEFRAEDNVHGNQAEWLKAQHKLERFANTIGKLLEEEQ